LFQGYFFARPKTLSTKTISTLQINQIRLMQEISKVDFSLEIVSDIIKNDVSLAYKILRLVNSAYYGVIHKIDNIDQAIVYLGTEGLRKWLAFNALSILANEKTPELIALSMIRAYFCEQISRFLTSFECKSCFMIGLFSLLDALTDTLMEVCLESIYVPSIVSEALLGQDSQGKYLLELIKSIERSDWESVSNYSAMLQVSESQVSSAYLFALEQTEKIVQYN